ARAPDEDAAIAAIKKVNEAQKDYFFRNRSYALTYQELIDGRFLLEEPTVAKTGYEIKLRPKPDVSGYSILAVPASAAGTVRHFFGDQSGDIRAETGKEAAAASPKISQ
ncbi:MAG: hypothetical protein HY646_13490, partial [Acidobacteria bacterium]|nr:hypothetical protein [Acidobacteriota bacterium]